MSGLEGTGREGDEPLDDAVESKYSIDDVEELSLSEEEEPLPWLESGDYDDEEEGVDTGRIIGFVVMAALALAVLFGAIWFFSNQSTDPELIADGSTIEAPEGPTKEKPEVPGGRTFAGTGDVAPAVSEGQSREGRLAEQPAPKPTIDVATTINTAATGGVAVQVGAYSTKASAETGWNVLNRQTDAIKGFKYRIVEGKADIGTVYRLQAVTADAAAAKSLCDTLRADGLACQVK